MNNITKLIPTMQAVSLLKHNTKKKKKKNIAKTGMENIVGLAMIKETARYV